MWKRSGGSRAGIIVGPVSSAQPQAPGNRIPDFLWPGREVEEYIRPGSEQGFPRVVLDGDDDDGNGVPGLYRPDDADGHLLRCGLGVVRIRNQVAGRLEQGKMGLRLGGQRDEDPDVRGCFKVETDARMRCPYCYLIKLVYNPLLVANGNGHRLLPILNKMGGCG